LLSQQFGRKAAVDLPGTDNQAVEGQVHNLIEAIQGNAKVIGPRA
jgi:hypothetical protein